MEFTPVLCSALLRRSDWPRITCRPTWCTSTGTSDRTFPGLWILWSGEPRSMRTPCRAWWLKVRFYSILYPDFYKKKKIRAYSRGFVRTGFCLGQVTPCQSCCGPRRPQRVPIHISHHIPNLWGGGGRHGGISLWNSLSNSQSKPPFFPLNRWCWLDISPDVPLYKSLVNSNQQLPSVLFSHLAWLD